MTTADAPAEQLGRYRILDVLGEGGMCTVHLAEFRDQNGERQRVALKRLRPSVAARKDVKESFVHEASLLHHLDHENIPKTFDSGRIGDTYFIAMEFIRGPTLKKLLEQCRATGGSIPVEITLNIVAQICDALDHTHNRCDEHGRPLGIIHRDISPANVIISETGVVKLIDFGLAKAKSSTVETAEGVIKGKYSYLAPEYISGRLDLRADIWGLGVAMYEMLTGARLFEASDAFETVARVRNMPIPEPSRANPRIPPELDGIVMTALQRDPNRRWRTAANMRASLLGVMAQLGNKVDNRQVVDWVNRVSTQA